MNSNSKHPYISVIIPVYNVINYLDRCLNSVVNQTYKNLEIILIDDGSTDESGFLCDKWKEKDERITVVHKENGGLSSARNAGLDFATGDYVGFVDSDDEINVNYFESFIKSIHDSDLVVGRLVRIENGSRKEAYDFTNRNISNFLSLLSNILLEKNDCSCCTKLFKKNIIGNYRFPCGSTNEDFAFLLQILFNHNGNISFSEKSEYYYYMNENSITTKPFSIKSFDKYYNAKLAVKICCENKRLKDASKYYLIKQCIYLYKHLIFANEDRLLFKFEYKLIKNELKKNILNIVLNKHLLIRDKLSYLCIIYFSKTYVRRHCHG